MVYITTYNTTTEVQKMKTINELEKQISMNNKEIKKTLYKNKKYSKEIPIYLIHIVYYMLENLQLQRQIINRK